MSHVAPERIRRRAEREDDLPFLLELYASTRERELSLVPWTAEQKAAFVRSQFDAQWKDYHTHRPGADFDVVEVDGRPAGRVIVDRGADELRIVDLAVAPAWRNRGIGAHLIGEILAQARALGLAVRFHVETSNPARRLYERLGFVEIGRTGIHHLLQWTPDEPVE